VDRQGITLVTGAGGFIGGRIVEMFHLAGARRVRAGIHRWSSCARIGRFPVDIVALDLTDRTTLSRALEGVNEIVHCAKGNREVTVEGTRLLLEAAIAAGVHRFVHLSTAEVYGAADGTFTEQSECTPTGREYGDMKLEAEHVCREFSERGLALTILRPPIVYGPFSTWWTVDLARKLISGRWGTMGARGEGICNLLYVDDLVRAIRIALEHPRAAGATFNVNGKETTSWNSYFVKLALALGLPPLAEHSSPRAAMRANIWEPVRRLGAFLKRNYLGTLKAIAARCRLVDTMMRATERRLKTAPSRAELALFGRKALFPADKICSELGFVPAVSIDEGTRLSAEWLRHEGFLLGR